MNRGEMRAAVAWRVSFSDDAADQDFTTKRINLALQETYTDEIRQAKLEGRASWFRKTTYLTWPASQTQLQLPLSISRRGILAIWDETSGSPGARLSIGDTSLDGSGIWWAENDKLQYGSSGPASALTLRVEYEANAEFLGDPNTTAGDTLEPALIPQDYHMLLVWGAVVLLKEVADEQVSRDIRQRYQAIQRDYWKFVSKGRPFSETSIVGGSSSYGLGFIENEIEAGPGGSLDP